MSQSEAQPGTYIRGYVAELVLRDAHSREVRLSSFLTQEGCFWAPALDIDAITEAIHKAEAELLFGYSALPEEHPR